MGKYKEQPRYQMISCRVSDEEYWKVVELSQKQKVSLSEAARLMMFGGAR